MSDVAAATMTWARSEAESDLLHHSLEVLAGQGLPVFAADGGSPPEFLARLARVPGLTLVQAPRGPGSNLVRQVRTSLAAAAGTGARRVLYTEPDKGWFFRHRLGELLRAGERGEDAALLVPARDAGSFGTFPRGQQLAESLFHQLAAGMLGLEGDLTYGPMLLRPELVALLDEVPDDLGWGWRTFLLAAVHRQGLPVRFHPADLPCPEAQRGEDTDADRAYRMEQLAQGVRGLVLAMRR